MAKLAKSAKNGTMKPGMFLQFMKASYKNEVFRLRNELETKRLDLEAKCQTLQEALEELEESRNRYAALYDFAPVGYATLDYKGCIQEINLTGASLIGWDRSRLIGMPMCVFVVKSDMKMFLDHLRRCRLSNGKVITELCLAAKSGSPVQVQLLSVPHISAGGDTFQYKTVITDITERKLSYLDRLNLVGEMAAGIGHEIRNPMTTVRGFLQLYREREAFTQYKDSFDLMIDELDRANSIITEFISLARNKMLDLEIQNLNKILENLFPLIQADAMLSNANIIMQMEDIPELPLDEKEINQLILNLVRNGIEAMASGGNLTIRTYTDSQEVVLSVQDQGSGIEPGMIEKIGTPFFTTKDYGTGLGLAVCYSIAARHNAVISMETSSAGTTFFVRFKL